MAGSNDTLFGLAAHLQTMENNLTDFIFHCALRLSTMTDSRVFVLMENPNDGSGGRRFCGSEALVEEFVTHGLHKRGVNDVEMELNIDSPPVRQKQQQQHQQQQYQLQPHQHLPNKGILPSSGRKRHGATNAALVESDNSAKKVRPSEEASSAEEDSSSLALECKTEVVEFLIDSDSDEETSAGNESSFANGGSSSSAFLDSFDSSFLPSSSSNIPIHDPSYSGGAEELPSRRIGLNVPNLEAKERAVAQIVDPTKAFVRGTMENKLLASICYDAGKAVTLSNPHPVESPLFRDHCKERIHAYVQHFPEFVNVAVTLEATALFTRELESQMYTPESFMRMNARNGQKRALKAMRKTGDG